MDNTQTITIIVSILVPMLAGFAWIIHQINDLKTRVTILEMRVGFIEKLLEMGGISVKPIRQKEIIDSK